MMAFGFWLLVLYTRRTCAEDNILKRNTYLRVSDVYSAMEGRLGAK